MDEAARNWLDSLRRMHKSWSAPHEGDPRYDMPPRSTLPRLPQGSPTLRQPILTPETLDDAYQGAERAMKRQPDFRPFVGRDVQGPRFLYQQQIIRRMIESMPPEDAIRLLNELDRMDKEEGNPFLGKTWG